MFNKIYCTELAEQEIVPSIQVPILGFFKPVVDTLRNSIKALILPIATFLSAQRP